VWRCGNKRRQEKDKEKRKIGRNRNTDAKNKIIGMKQGKRTFGELVADFETWASRTGWSEQDLFDRLKQTLNADYINRLFYFPVVAKDYDTLKAYGHSIDLQLTDLHNN
jgi:hypothetical protein